MSTNQASAPVLYNSLYRNAVDEKRRLQIPAKWRPVEENFQFTLILWPSSATKQSYLLVLPPDPMNALLEKLKQMPYSDPKADHHEIFRSHFAGSSRANFTSHRRRTKPRPPE